MVKPFKLSKRVKNELDKIGGFRIKSGGHHLKIYVDNRLVGISPHYVKGDGQIGGSAERNVIASIRRVAANRNSQVVVERGGT